VFCAGACTRRPLEEETEREELERGGWEAGLRRHRQAGDVGGGQGSAIEKVLLLLLVVGGRPCSRDKVGEARVESSGDKVGGARLQSSGTRSVEPG